MAIIRSLAIGKGRKSAGNLTFRTVRGRTIVSEKVGERAPTRAPSAAQTQRTSVFGLISRFAKMHAASIGVSFDKTRYGSQRNYFAKLNYGVLFEPMLALVDEVSDINQITDVQIEAAVTAFATANPNQVVRISVQGSPRVYLAGAWTSIPDPKPIPPSDGTRVDSIGFNGSNVPFSTTGAATGSVVTIDEGNDVYVGYFTLKGNKLLKASNFAYLVGSTWNNALIDTQTNTLVEWEVASSNAQTISAIKCTIDGVETVYNFV